MWWSWISGQDAAARVVGAALERGSLLPLHPLPRPGPWAITFVREQRKQATVTEPFVCLGFARYVSHEAERPMAIRWRLEREIPVAWMPVMALPV